MAQIVSATNQDKTPEAKSNQDLEYPSLPTPVFLRAYAPTTKATNAPHVSRTLERKEAKSRFQRPYA
jgi:hypothetical protein